MAGGANEMTAPLRSSVTVFRNNGGEPPGPRAARETSDVFRRWRSAACRCGGRGGRQNVCQNRLAAPYFVEIGSRDRFLAKTAGQEADPAADFSLSGAMIRFLEHFLRMPNMTSMPFAAPAVGPVARGTGFGAEETGNVRERS